MTPQRDRIGTEPECPQSPDELREALELTVRATLVMITPGLYLSVVHAIAALAVSAVLRDLDSLGLTIAPLEPSVAMAAAPGPMAYPNATLNALATWRAMARANPLRSQDPRSQDHES